MKKLKFTNHGKERLEERFGMDKKKAQYLFSKSILFKEYGDVQLHENIDSEIIFVVHRGVMDYFLLITIYKKGEYNPEIALENITT